MLLMSLTGWTPSSLPLQEVLRVALTSAVLGICRALALSVAVGVTVKFSS